MAAAHRSCGEMAALGARRSMASASLSLSSLAAAMSINVGVCRRRRIAARGIIASALVSSLIGWRIAARNGLGWHQRARRSSRHRSSSLGARRRKLGGNKSAASARHRSAVLVSGLVSRGIIALGIIGGGEMSSASAASARRISVMSYRLLIGGAAASLENSRAAALGASAHRLASRHQRMCGSSARLAAAALGSSAHHHRSSLAIGSLGGLVNGARRRQLMAHHRRGISAHRGARGGVNKRQLSAASYKTSASALGGMARLS